MNPAGSGKRPRLKQMATRVAVMPSRVKTFDPGSWRLKTGGKTAARGYDSKWQTARLEHLAKNPLCVKCTELNLVELGNVVDHIVPHRGDMKLFWDRKNWQTLCTPHHSADKQREERGLEPLLP